MIDGESEDGDKCEELMCARWDEVQLKVIVTRCRRLPRGRKLANKRQ